MSDYPPSLNPFLADDDKLFSVTASFYSADHAPPQFPPPPLPVQQMSSNLKLPSFWPDAPVAWFAAAEAQFQLRRIHSQAERFCHVTAALDKSTLKKVVHIIVSPDPVQPFNKLKEALLASHILTDFQKVELILAMEPLGARKPSELLADMLELCPADQQNNIFFAALFLQRLPREIRVLLTHEDHSDLRRLAAHADQLVAFGGRSDLVAAVDISQEQESTVAAMKGFKPKHKGNQRGKQQKFQSPPPLPPRPKSGNKTQEDPPGLVARQAAGLCYYHWTFGDKAHSCEAPCSWQGN